MQHLGRYITAALYTAAVAGSWDVWWHSAIGRDSFWEPPHILLYSATIVAIGLGVYGWEKTREKVWRRLACTILFIPVVAPFDELWHRLFGVESIASPAIVWSPPHLVLIGSIVASFAMLLPLLDKDRDPHARRLFGAMAFAGILSLLSFVVVPLQPTGPFALLGFWGAGAGAFVMVLVYFFGQRWIGGVGSTFSLALVFLALAAIELGEGVAQAQIITPHDHPPAWLTIFAILLPAVAIDLMPRESVFLKGALAGAICCGLLYVVAPFFFAPEFRYGFEQAIIAVMAGTVGGMLAGVAAKLRPSLFSSAAS